MLPNFLGIGAPRCGTTLLDTILRSHPDIFLPVERKEIDFFASYFERGVGWYENFFTRFPESGARLSGEVTPGYLKHPRGPQRIKDTLPDTRFIVILRDPVERMVSRYKYGMARKGEATSFSDVANRTEPFEAGCYASALERYFEVFPRERFLILFYEDLQAEPASVVSKLADFLEVDAEGFDLSVFNTRINASDTVMIPQELGVLHEIAYRLKRYNLDGIVDRLRKPAYALLRFGRPRQTVEARIDEDDLDALGQRYEPEIVRLEHILGVSLAHWRRNNATAAQPAGEPREMIAAP